jgi:hypothetical protein
LCSMLRMFVGEVAAGKSNYISLALPYAS